MVAIGAIVVYFQSTPNFASSWTSSFDVSPTGNGGPNNRTDRQQVQGLLGQWAVATVARLGIVAMLNLQVMDFIIEATVRIPPLRFLLKIEN